MPTLQVSTKSLKLTNAVIASISPVDLQDMAFVEKMENYIKSKGYQPLGPIIQYTGVRQNDSGEAEMVVQILRQATGYINHIEPPYSIEAVFRVPKCLYVRYTGPEDKLTVAYNKLNVVSFEEDVPVTGNTYTVFVNQLDDGDIVADVFMEIAHD